MSLLTSVIFASAIISPPVEAGAAQPLILEEVFAPDPFVSPVAVAAFQKYIKDLEAKYDTKIDVPADFWRAAPEMSYWGYRFRPKGETFEVLFEQQYRLSDMIDSVLSQVNAIKYDGCSYFHTRNAHVTAVSLRSVQFRGDIDGKQRTCGTIPVINVDYKTDLGDIGGKVDVSLTFREEQTGSGVERYRGQLIANDPNVNVNAEATSIFGINVNSVGGQILSAVLTRPIAAMSFAKHPSADGLIDVINIFNTKALRFSANPDTAFVFASIDRGTKTSEKYRNFLTKITSLTWSTQPNFALSSEAGLSGSPNDVRLRAIFFAPLRESEPPETVYADVVREIDLIKSFSKGPKEYMVARGDSLSKIATREYGSAVYWSFIAGSNQLRRVNSNRLVVGQKLMLLPRYQLITLNNVYFALPGDNLSKICNRHVSPRPLRSCIAEIRKENRIVGDRIYALEPIRVPAS